MRFISCIAIDEFFTDIVSVIDMKKINLFLNADNDTFP